MSPRDDHISRLRDAFRRNNLTLYLGAGVSVGNGLPTWEKLVLSMYFSAISAQSLGGWRPFANYLFAIAEWHLERDHAPLEITARKIRNYYGDQTEFLRNLRQTLYAGFLDEDGTMPAPVDPQALRYANPTLDAVARLCEAGIQGGSGVSAVITYNYDTLLEMVLETVVYQSIWQKTTLQPDILPIYHVHGAVPIDATHGSTPSEIVFTEEQYHRAAQDPYSWSNLVQIQCMSSSVGLMIGLSLSDRNMRRLLDAVRNAPVHSEHYVLMQEPHWRQPGDIELEDINEKALQYLDRFLQSGMAGPSVSDPGVKGGPTWREQIRGILRQVERLDIEQQTTVFEQLGVHPIWYKDHGEIPAIVDEILPSSS